MYDVAIIGGGVCGCSLLYSLSRYNVRAVLLERENDVAVGTTKANSAIVHAGYDPLPGTLMARYNLEGNRMMPALCADLDIHFKQNGSLVVAFSPAERPHVEELYRRGLQNGVPGLRIVEQDELREMEPELSENALCALHAPSAGIINPWEMAIAMAQVAVQNGAEVRLNSAVLAIEKQGDTFTVSTVSGDVPARFVVNAAGIHAAQISAMLGAPGYRITPNRGQYYIFDTTQGATVQRVIFQCPNELGKGVLVSPTVHGNLIIGPDSAPADFDDFATTAQGQAFVRETALRSVPSLQFRESIRNFAGLRARADVDDFIVGPSAHTEGFFEIAGIQSPGLTAAPAIAEDMVRLLGQAGLALAPKENPVTTRQVRRFKDLDEAARAEAIRQNPLYGRIVCRCETITEGEIVDALHSPLPPISLDGVKRRCMPGLGRCQGGFCGPRVQAIIARELGLPQAEVPLDRAGTDIITGETKTYEGGDFA